MNRTFPKIKSWAELEKAYKDFSPGGARRWVFRGQQRACWDLTSTLERVANQRFGEPFTKLRKIEERVVREFRRHFHRYSNVQIDDDDDLRCLAIMQHHGAPTRLLDWTYSFYVALYFAAEAARPGKDTGVIWGVDLDWCWRAAKNVVPGAVARYEINDKDRPTTHGLLSRDVPLAIAVTPFGLDERIAVQQGLFLAPLNMSATFEASLDAMEGSGDGEGNVRGIQLAWDQDFLTTTITELQRININRRSLYPGLDGLAVGLHNWIATLPLMPLRQDLADH
jgi:hypothetical protein